MTQQLYERSRSVYRELNTLIHVQQVAEEARISLANQARSMDEHSSAHAIIMAGYLHMEELEHSIEKLMHDEVKHHPAWPWLDSVRGIGAQTACLMLAYLLEPIPTKGVSSWYKAAGLYPTWIESDEGSVYLQQDDGTTVRGEYHLPRPRGSEKITYHPRMRRNLKIVGDCLLRAGGFYAMHYRDFRGQVNTAHPDWPKHRQHSVAFWKMTKLFMGHLYEVWADATGIVVPEPYSVVHMTGHVKIPVPYPAG